MPRTKNRATGLAAFSLLVSKEEQQQGVLGTLACLTWIGCWVVLPIGVPLSVLALGLPRASLAVAVLALAIAAPKLRRWGELTRFMQGMTEHFASHEIRHGERLSEERVKPVLFAHHPHGLFAVNVMAVGSRPSCRAVVAPVCLQMPFCRQMMEALGAVGSARRELSGVMRGQESLAIIPGGVDEVVLASARTERVFIKTRFGFVALALEHGYDLLPIYHFGENELYDIAWPLDTPWARKLRLWLVKHFGIPIIIGFGWPLCPFLPKKNVHCCTVVGETLRLPQIDHPSRNEVAAYHKLYVNALVDLYNKNRDSLPNYAEKDLELW